MEKEKIFNLAIKYCKVNYINHLYCEGRDLITISNNKKRVCVPAIPFINTINQIYAGRYKSNERVSMHPNPVFDDVGNIISRPISIEYANDLLVFKNIINFINICVLK